MLRLRTPRFTPAGAAIAGVYLGFVAFALLQQPGRTTYDTRLELTARPGSFLASAFSLWQPDVNFGELQNQANGYLFPQGPFFLLAHLLHVAPWVSQRIWSALVVIAACEGMRRIGRALDLPASASFLGGLVFAFSPRLIATSGVLTGEALPGALAPWACLPLLLAARGRLATRPAVLLGVAAVVAMGGVNAVETGAAIIPAAVIAVWIAAHRLVSWRFLAGWAATVVVATAWWTLPLLASGRYSPPFYEYVESAATTTSFVGWSEAVRGDTHWLSWNLLPDGRPWWPAAHLLATNSLMVAISALVTAAGLVGLARWPNRFRVPFAFSAAIGLAAITVAHGGAAGTPLSGAARSALDGALQLFRNVHKFDPAVRIAVAIGVAALFAEVVERLDRRQFAGATGRWVIVPACLVLTLGAPYLVNDSRTPGWQSLPSSWQSAREWLSAHDDGRAVLVLPASGFALQPWGATLDEPALALDVRHRVALTQAPLVPGATLRFLSALNGSITSGQAREVAEDLARAGIGYVVVRRDLNRAETGTPTTDLTETALSDAGLERTAMFGADGVAPVAIYRVPGNSPRLRVTPAKDVVTVAGEPESVPALQEAGLSGEAIVLRGDSGWDRPADVVTDGAKRRERQFGSLYGSRSVVLQAGEAYRVPRAAHDYPGVARERPVLAAYDGLAALRASSSRGYADTFGEVVPAEGPAAAVDADRSTRWVTSPASDPTRQWIRLTFSKPRQVHAVAVEPVVGDPALAPVRQIEVVAGAQHHRLDVSPDGATVVARFNGSVVPSVTVRITRVGVAEPRAPVALAGVHVDGLVPTATLRVPEPLRAGTAFVFGTDPGVRPCTGSVFGPDCDESRRRTPEEPAGMDRTFDVVGGDAVTVSGSVAARLTPRALRLLEPVGREQRVRASSVLGNDPRAASRFAWDGDDDTAWIPSDSDPGPTLVFRWSRPHVVSGIRVTSPDPQLAPGRALLRADGRAFGVSLSGSTTTSFPKVRTRKLQVTFQRPEKGARLILGEVELAGANVTQPFDRSAVTGAICGLGPHVVVDGQVHQSQVRGTLGDLVDGRPLRLSVCDIDRPDVVPSIHLGPGEHRLTTPPTSQFQTVSVVGAGSPGGAASPTRSISVKSWAGTRRTATVGPGSAAVLSMSANANPGWRATLDGAALHRVRVDGWKQGWLLPSGKGGRLVIDYPPQGWYRVLLIGALVPGCLVVLAALLLLPGRRRTGRSAVPEAAITFPRWTAALAGVLLLALGAAAAVGALVGRLGRRTPWPVPIGGLSVLASGLLDAVHAASPGDGIADLLAAGGFGLLFATAVSRTGESS